MTNAEWYSSTDPVEMIDALQPTADPAQLRLFGCRSCRLIWDLLRDPRCQDAVEVAERYVTGAATVDELEAAWREAEDAVNAAEEAAGSGADYAYYAAASAARAAAVSEAWGAPGLWAVEQPIRAVEQEGRGRDVWLRGSLCQLARDMFPPPSDRSPRA